MGTSGLSDIVPCGNGVVQNFYGAVRISAPSLLASQRNFRRTLWCPYLLFVSKPWQSSNVSESIRPLHRLINVKVPFIDAVVARLDLRIQELTVRCETKTKDNVFVQMTVAVQYQIQNPYDAFYKLANPRGQIESYVYDVVRARVPSLLLDQAFEAKDDVARAVKDQLADIMDDFGYLIVKAPVVDIDPDSAVKESMNRINAAERLKSAAEMEVKLTKFVRLRLQRRTQRLSTFKGLVSRSSERRSRMVCRSQRSWCVRTWRPCQPRPSWPCCS